MGEEKHWVRTCGPRRDLRGKESLHGQTLTLESEQAEAQTGYCWPGVLLQRRQGPLAAGRTARADRRAGEA